MNILIVDGQGGGVGKALVERISDRCRDVDITAVGTNSMATVNMLKGGKINGATGENAVVYNSSFADIIVGPIGIVMANSMFGEITPKMAEAIAGSRAKVILIPMSKCQIHVVGIEEKKVADYVDEAVDEIVMIQKNIMKK